MNLNVQLKIHNNIREDVFNKLLQVDEIKTNTRDTSIIQIKNKGRRLFIRNEKVRIINGVKIFIEVKKKLSFWQILQLQW